MADNNLTLKTTHADGDVFYAGITTDTDKLNGIAAQINRNLRNKWFKNFAPATAPVIAAFSSTAWTTDQYVTSDGGTTWSSGGPGSGFDVIKVCDANGTRAVAGKTSDGTVKYTTDSGANWSSPSTAPPNISKVYDIHYITASLCILCGTGGTKQFWYSTDGGDNWVEATSGSGDAVDAVSMISSTTGFAITSTGKIHKTTDGGANWSDTGHTSAVTGTSARICAVSTSGCILANIGQGIHLYSGSANSVSKGRIYANTTDMSALSEIVKCSNGNYYLVWLGPGILFKSEDSGVSWKCRPIGISGLGTTNGSIMNSALTQYTTDKMLLAFGSNLTGIIEIDET